LLLCNTTSSGLLSFFSWLDTKFISPDQSSIRVLLNQCCLAIEFLDQSRKAPENHDVMGNSFIGKIPNLESFSLDKTQIPRLSELRTILFCYFQQVSVSANEIRPRSLERVIACGS
jgi:hypothetical protein